MNRRGLVMWSAWGLLSGSVVGQAQAPTQPSPPPSVQALTLIGCIRPWDQSTMGPPPAVAMGGTTPVLVLTDAEKRPESAVPGKLSPAPEVAKPPTGGGPAAGGHSTYLLKAVSTAVDLAGHLDHRVELSGTLAPDDAAATPAAPPTPPGSRATGTPSDGAARPPAPPVSFTVDRIKMIDKSCTAK